MDRRRRSYRGDPVRRRSGRRYRSGYTLLIVLAIAAASLVVIGGLSQMVMEGNRSISQYRFDPELVNAAEGTMDYVVHQLNSALTAGTLGSFPATIPNASVPATIKGNQHAYVRADVAAIAPPQESYLYDQLKNGYPWRQVTVQVKYAGHRKALQVALRPELVWAGTSATPGGGKFFLYPIFARSLVQFEDTSRTASGSDFDANIASNDFISLKDSSKVAGDLIVLFPSFANQNSIQADAGTVVENDVFTMGTASGLPSIHQGLRGTIANPEIQKNAVPNFVDANSPGSFPTGDDGIYTYQSNVPPALSPPPDALDLGSVHLGDNSGIPNQTPDNDTLVWLTDDGNTLHVRPGNYKVSGLDMGAGGKIVIEPKPATWPSEAPSITKIFLDGQASGGKVVEVNGGRFEYGTGMSAPGKFQMWYTGTKDLSLQADTSAGQFHGVVYAPNANLTIGKKSATSVYTGAFVGNRVRVMGDTTVAFPGAAAISTSSNQLTYNPAAQYFGLTPQFRPGNWREFIPPDFN